MPPTTEYVFYTQPHLVRLVKAGLGDIIGAGNGPRITIVSDYRDKWRWFLSSDLALVCMGHRHARGCLGWCADGGNLQNRVANGFLLWRRLIKVATICLPNLLAGKNIVPELIQEDLTLEKLITTARAQF